MQNSPNSTPSSDSTIAKLLEVEADLAAQEAQLNAQLVSIQEKRHSLKTVIDMFVPGDVAPVASVAPPTQTPVTQAETASAEVEAEPTALDVTPKALDETAKTDTSTDVQVSAKGTKRQSKASSSSASTKSGKKSAPAKKSSKATDTWQQYVTGEFSNASLAEAVAQVMQQYEKKVVDIATIIDTIFTDEIPKQLRSTARERISNVLSVGAKSGKWYRGKLGKYSMSKQQ